MSDVLKKVSRPALLSIAKAMRAGRILAPYNQTHFHAHLSPELAHLIAKEFNDFSSDGASATSLARFLRALADERATAQAATDQTDLVWSGLDIPGAESRDAPAVVRELLSSADHDVLIATFAIDEGEKAAGILGTLATRMDINPQLRARMFVNIPRKHRDTTPDSILIKKFADRFKDKIWPGDRLPQVYFDPRSLATDGPTRACLHAKCVVVDHQRSLDTSANFTEAAQVRNIEAGVVINDPAFAKRLVKQFDVLVELGKLRRLPGISPQWGERVPDDE